MSGDVDVSRFDAAPLIAFTVTKPAQQVRFSGRWLMAGGQTSINLVITGTEYDLLV
ncbi:hypothetical protein SAMN06265173_12062 [Thalassovita litoralis]|uniref:Uncharacterized protein n=1 Tax=Thalassovita litoralis TaxID=1010611 RepID=A0A521EVR7_9RHOB|nr:hypothetical protein [Thalassovita litoralis]SMO88004.1 hypothetical protein SAMN06265173_12062 [Thalassovita litoralis]